MHEKCQTMFSAHGTLFCILNEFFYLEVTKYILEIFIGNIYIQFDGFNHE